nr:immunoglobulin heavy chain junction region [Mus musculus]MBK4188598.1 immunoglobulin heavy chain junction region [Mus musculus]
CARDYGSSLWYFDVW